MSEKALASARWENQDEVSQRFLFNYKSFWLGRAEDGSPIGYNDDRHICLVSGTRGGKGTSIITNNLCFWPGSAVVIDPKGENATITAARRGRGDEFCEGMGQKVIVLDPFNVAKVDDAYRSSFNPLDALDPSSERCIDEAARIANALVVVREDSKDPFFDESARALVKSLILHVLTSTTFDEEQRTLATVHTLLKRGDWRIAQDLRDAGLADMPSPHTLLFRAMEDNEALDQVVASYGTRYLAMLDNSPKTFDNVLQAALVNTEFLDSPGMRRVVQRSSFKLSELKGDAQGVTLYLSLPQDYVETHYRWLRLMIMLTVGEMRKSLAKPATGHRVLFVLDEFAGLKRMPVIENAVAQLAGYGVKLFFVLQSLEQLKATYKENWETFLSCAGLKIFFSIEDHFTRQYVSALLGMEEVLRTTESESTGTSETENVAKGTSRGETQTDGTTRGTTNSRSQTTADGRSTGRNSSTNRSNSRGENWGENWGESASVSDSQNWSQGGSSGVSYKKTSFFGLFESIDKSSVTHSSGSNYSFGGSTSQSQSYSQGGNRGGSRSSTSGISEGQNEGRSQTLSNGKSEGESSSTSKSFARSKTDSETYSRGSSRSSGTSRNQGIHQKPLLRPEDFGKLFARVDDESHDAFPGFALVLVAGANPFVVHRCNYFEDAQFIDWFTPNPGYDFKPALSISLANIQPYVKRLGAAIAPGGAKLRIGSWEVAPHEVVSSGGPLFAIGNVPRDLRTIRLRAPCHGKVIKLSSRSGDADAEQRWPQLDAAQLVLLKHYEGKEGLRTNPLAEVLDALRRLEETEVRREAAPHVKQGVPVWWWAGVGIAGAIAGGLATGAWELHSGHPEQLPQVAGVFLGVPALIALPIGIMKLSRWLRDEHDIEPGTQWKVVGVIGAIAAVGTTVWLVVRYWDPILDFLQALFSALFLGALFIWFAAKRSDKPRGA